MPMLYVISDTHVPERISKFPHKFVDKIRSQDVIFHAGDFVSWDAFKELESLATLHAVRGNMDHSRVKSSLDKKKLVSLHGKKVGIYHGSGSPTGLGEKVYKEFGEKPDVIIFGHSHIPYNKKKENTLLFNPGSLSGNTTGPFATYGVLTIEGGEIWGDIFELT